MLFHEFIFCLGRIANDCIHTSDSIQDKLRDFFVEKLNFKGIEDVDAMVSDLVFGKRIVEEDSEYESEYESEEELDEQQLAFQAFLARRAEEESEFQIDYLQVLEELKDNLPEIPDKPVVEQVNPPPYNLPRIKFGKLMPKPEDDDPKKKKKQKKK